jgi:hypothetical protein
MLIPNFKYVPATDAQRAAVLVALTAQANELASLNLRCLFFNRDAILATGVISNAMTAGALWIDLVADGILVPANGPGTGYVLMGASAPVAA